MSTLLVAKENREAIGTTFWDLLVDTVSGDWLSGPIGLQKVLKTKMSLLLETVSEFQPAYGEKSLRCIQQIIRIFLRQGVHLSEVLHPSKSLRSQDLNKDHVSEHPLWVWNVISALWQDPCFSTEQKAELRAMFLTSMNPTALPFRLYPYPTLRPTLVNPGQSVKRSTSDFDSAVTISPNQLPIK